VFHVFTQTTHDVAAPHGFACVGIPATRLYIPSFIEIRSGVSGPRGGQNLAFPITLASRFLLLQQLVLPYKPWYPFLLYSSAHAEPAHVVRFWRSIRHTTTWFRPRMCFLGPRSCCSPFWGQNVYRPTVVKLFTFLFTSLIVHCFLYYCYHYWWNKDIYLSKCLNISSRYYRVFLSFEYFLKVSV